MKGRKYGWESSRLFQKWKPSTRKVYVRVGSRDMLDLMGKVKIWDISTHLLPTDGLDNVHCRVVVKVEGPTPPHLLVPQLHGASVLTPKNQ